LPGKHLVDTSLGPEEHAEWIETLDAVQRLTHRHRIPLVLFVQGASIAEIAVFLKCTPEAAKQRLFRARQALRAKLGDGYIPNTVTSSKGRAQ
jgi:DNA-directed RNA polymerase specialized sigma24 family protein